MIGILIAVLVAALVYFLCIALQIPWFLALAAAILVLIAGVPTEGFEIGERLRRRGGRFWR